METHPEIVKQNISDQNYYFLISHSIENKSNSYTDQTDLNSPTMMCKAEVTASLVPTVVKQIQSVDPVEW